MRRGGRRRIRTLGWVLAASLVVGCGSEVSAPEASPTSQTASAPAGSGGFAPASAREGSAASSAVSSTRPAAPSGRPAPSPRVVEREQVPAPMRPCFSCHKEVVTAYLDHGMAGSVGPLGEPPTGVVTNPLSGHRYEVEKGAQGAVLTAVFPDGGQRVQRLVGRIGAGVFDVSWVGEELDVGTGEGTGRLFFAPVESITGHGLVLSPFELRQPSAGLDLALTDGCLTCHTLTPLASLHGAATVAGSGAGSAEPTDPVFPANALGATAFAELSPLTCDACHGDPRRHLELMAGLAEGLPGDVGLTRLGTLGAGEQRDVCARCHLQGDARLDLVGGAPRRDRPLAGQIPVLVPAHPDDDFRFVGQVERLALSPCFAGSPEMTCTTCHAPHQGVAAQGVASFDAACAGCHACGRAPAVTAAAGVPAVTGAPARSEAGCVDCHVRRSQPFDLPHVRSADHFIRRRIPPPEDDVPHRQFADPDGALRLFDDGRLAKSLATPDGERWRAGVMAMGLLTLGRVEEAARGFAAFPAPGSPAARQTSAPPPLAPLEPWPAFHQTRALALLASGQLPAARAAFDDALALDPLAAGALLGRARLRLDQGDVPGALRDTQTVIDRWPRAEQPWQLRAELAERVGRPDLARSAFDAATRLWPADPVAWYKLGLLRRQEGDLAGARAALERARALRPSLSLPGAGPLADQ